MYHGEDLAKAAHASASQATVSGRFKPTGAPVGASVNFHDHVEYGSNSPKAPPLSISGLNDAVSAVDKSLFAHMEIVEQIAVQITTLTSKTVGPYPPPEPSAGNLADDAGIQGEPRSAIEALMRRVHLLHAPLNRMDAPLRETLRALEILNSSLS